ncbi:MAG TPA: hypothetical protein VF158_15960 [Longimicrobiales bacterium]
MKRPEKELSRQDIPSGIKATRRLLAYLLRGTVIRIDRDKIGERRYYELPTEITTSLVPFVVSERSPLGFYRAFCRRFEVDPAGGDSQWGPIEAWLPEGRIRWDRALAAMDYDDVRVVVHESPEFLSTFATDRYGIEGEDQHFDYFPDPVQSGGYVPQLPRELISPRAYRSVWTLTSPMHHGADEKHGNVRLFRRHRVHDPRTGRVAYVPFVSGNAIRGFWRDLVMDRWFKLLGLSTRRLPTHRAHALLAGGNVDAGADGAKVNNAVRDAARRACPPWDLFAGCIDKQIMSGRARVCDAILVCRENAWLVHPVIAPDVPLDEFAERLPFAAEMTQLRLLTRQAHRDVPESDGMQMIANKEVLIAGYQMVHTLQIIGLDGIDPVTASCLADLLEHFRATAYVGADAARGMGGIALDGYAPGRDAAELPPPDLYLEDVERRRDEMIEWAMALNEIAPTKNERPKKRKAPAEASS